MKRFFTCIITLIFIIYSVSVQGAYIFETQKTQRINDAITYEEREILSDIGWIKAYAAYVDMTNSGTNIKVLTSSKGASYLETVKNMAKNEGATLAINGDFFNLSEGQTNMLGMTYSQSELISSPALDNLVSFVITEENEVIMDYFAHSSGVISPQGYKCPIYQINKMPVSSGAITLLTPSWASVTPSKGFKVLGVENDVVTFIKETGSDGVLMPQNGYVLVTNPEINGFFDNFEIGDTVTVEIDITPNIEAIKEATGGNTLLVDDGKVARFTNNITGRAQRSSVGVTSDGKTLILLAIDGRTKSCPGLTQEELANLMINLGAKRAVNLDGGGSTTLTLKKHDGSYEIKNNVTSERKVSTAIGVFSDVPTGKNATHGILTPSQSVILEGDTIGFDVIFFDKYENAFTKNASSVKLYDQNKKIVPLSGFSPSVGKHTIYAELDKAVATCEIEVIDELFSIDAIYDTIELGKGKSANLSVYGYGKDGQKTLINPSLLEWHVSSDGLKIEKGKLTSQDGEGAIVTIRYKDVVDYVNINKSKTKEKTPPPIYGSDILQGSIDGKRVSVSGNVNSGATLLNRLISLKRLSDISECDLSFVTSSDYVKDLFENIRVADEFSTQRIENTLFVTISTKGGSIAKGTDWAKLGKALNEECANVVVISEFTPDLLSADERDRAKLLLENASKKGKNVFFVSSGDANSIKIENSVRYITCGTVSDYKTSNMTYNSKSCQYVSFSLSGDEIKFEFKE